MNRHKKMRKDVVFILILTLIGFFCGKVNSASAVTFSQNIGVNFTFNTGLILNLSSPLISVANLAPGTAADSNIVDVNVLSNSPAGFVLSASVGNNTTYNTSDLTHSDTNQVAKFTNVATNASIASLSDFQDNTWAYSYSTNNGRSWANYSGLPLYSAAGKVLIDSTLPSSNTNGEIVKFKIAARAANTQAFGTYNNVINFSLVAKPVPVSLEVAFANAGASKTSGYYSMQDMTYSICNSVNALDERIQLIDKRDYKVYVVAKLRDGNCWMMQNLDLDLSSDVTYTNEDTDLGYNTTSGTYETASWTPVRSTYQATASQTGTWCSGGYLSSGWCQYNYTPESYDPGNLFWNGSLDSSDVWFNYGWTCTYGAVPSCSDTNPIGTYSSNYSSSMVNHIGNYYNWAAAIAMNDISSVGASTMVEQSICPKGWTLPRSGDGYDTFKDLWSYYSYSGTDNPYTGSQSLASNLGYIPSGYYDGVLMNVGFDETMWSPILTASSTRRALSAHLNIDNGYPTGSHDIQQGYSIRCVARPVETTYDYEETN